MRHIECHRLHVQSIERRRFWIWIRPPAPSEDRFGCGAAPLQRNRGRRTRGKLPCGDRRSREPWNEVDDELVDNKPRDR